MNKAIEGTGEKKIVSPLMRLLSNLSMDDLLIFLDRTGVQWAIVRPKKGTYEANIYQEGMVKYLTVNKTSAKLALADSLARFLVGEDRDYHDYFVKGQERH